MGWFDQQTKVCTVKKYKNLNRKFTNLSEPIKEKIIICELAVKVFEPKR
jgi:hypothetical protein